MYTEFKRKDITLWLRQIHYSAITQNVNNVNSFTLLLETLIIPPKHEAWIDEMVKNGNAELTKKSQGPVERLKDFENLTGI